MATVLDSADGSPSVRRIPAGSASIDRRAPEGPRWPYRGDGSNRAHLLDFWGLWCGPCINGMPSLENLKRKYEPLGVVFLFIQTPDEEMDRIRRFLDLRKSPRVSALDDSLGKGGDTRDGVTAARHGVRNYPTLVLIDRRGNVAFPTGIR